jgi:hypothetical protein
MARTCRRQLVQAPTCGPGRGVAQQLQGWGCSSYYGTRGLHQWFSMAHSSGSLCVWWVAAVLIEERRPPPPGPSQLAGGWAAQLSFATPIWLQPHCTWPSRRPFAQAYRLSGRRYTAPPQYAHCMCFPA